MLRPTRVLLCLVMLGCFVVNPAWAQNGSNPDQLWADFTHYVRIAKPTLAIQAAEALVTTTDASDLLDAVEASRDADPAPLFQRAYGMEDLAQTAKELEDKIQQARIDRSRDPQRIADDITRLSDGQRAYLNAIQRLSAAGQFAVPQLLSALTKPDQADQHSIVMRALTDIGRPAVMPLATALPKLQPVTQGQVAQVLANIGYPQAAPALKTVIDNPATDPTARSKAQAAFEMIVNGTRLPTDLSAAEYYLSLGKTQFNRSTRNPQEVIGYDAVTTQGIIWRYDSQLTVNGAPGLTPIPVPGQILGDVLAMQAAESALALDADLDPALSLFLMANLRRENRLNEGETDPSYTSDRQDPMYYAMVAGPKRLHDVLNKALDDRDADLALDAIDALARTSSLEALKPLVRALDYPDRRVRFSASQALARALPSEEFDNSFRVVAVLSEAMRQSGGKIALIVAPNQESRNGLLAAADSMGYTTIESPSVNAAATQVAAAPGVDLILAAGNPDSLRGTVNASARNIRLAATPLVALTNSSNQAILNNEFAADLRVSVINADAQSEQVTVAVSQAVDGIGGVPIAEDEANAFALTSLNLLRDIAIDDNTVLAIQDALPALAIAVKDERAAIAEAAGNVLSRMDSSEAQAAIADAAINAVGDTQVAQLIDLAESANLFGNQINTDQTNAILDIVRTARGDLAVAAAQAHGALALPTENAVTLLLEGE